MKNRNKHQHNVEYDTRNSLNDDYQYKINEIDTRIDIILEQMNSYSF